MREHTVVPMSLNALICQLVITIERKISPKRHTVLENNRLPLGLHLCFRIVWNYPEICPEIVNFEISDKNILPDS